MNSQLKGKVAIVTGASRGIGSVIATQLAALGASVVINYRGDATSANQVVSQIIDQGGQAFAIQADISQVHDIEQLFTKTINHYGKIDIVVNNAGIMVTKPIAEVTEDDFDKHFSINVKGTYFACQQAMKHMEQGGKIINLSTSVTGQMFPNYSIYAGSKGAVEQFTRQLAKEFGAKGITINAIAPGPVKTELFLEGKTEQQIEALSKLNSFQRLGEPEDIANVIELLLSDKANWITGQTIRVNGGFI